MVIHHYILAANFCLCFWLGSVPFSCWFALSFGETQIWLGNLRFVLVGSLCLSVTNCVHVMTFFTLFFSPAYTHVRTEPQSVVGHTGGKSRVSCRCGCFSMICLVCEAKVFHAYSIFLPLLSLSGPSLRTRSGATEEKKIHSEVFDRGRAHPLLRRRVA